jgi:hypothetical protein
MITVGPMALNQPQAADPMEPFFLGTQSGGGYWTDISRLSSHDHSGGLMGAAVAVSIPDGSITAADLDPSVLAPYALVDGSKPFTGQVTMQADAVVRDAVLFGQQGTALAPDVTLSRTGAGALRVDTHLGVGVNPQSGWAAIARAVQVGDRGAVWSGVGWNNTVLSDNTYNDGTNHRAIVADAASKFAAAAGNLYFDTAPSVAAGAIQTFSNRMMLDQAGNLGVGVNPAAWSSSWRATQIGGATALWGHTTVPASFWTNNTYDDGSTRALVGSVPSLRLWLHDNDGSLRIQTAPSVAAGATQIFTTRAQIAPTGTLTLTPDAGQPALAAASAWLYMPTTNPELRAVGGKRLHLSAEGVVVGPPTDNAQNLGFSDAKWATVWSNTGTIQTSSQEFKEGITPLDPAACYQAAKDVRWYAYAYRPPAYTAPEPPPDIAYDAADDNETKAEKKAARDEAEAQAKAAHLKLVAETAPARHQRGFVFPAGAERKDEAGGTLPPVPALFGLSDRESTTPQADLATLGCALQHVIARLEALEGTAA